MSNVSLIVIKKDLRECMKRDSTLKLTNIPVGCNRIFCMKSIDDVCFGFFYEGLYLWLGNVSSYVGEFITLTIDLRYWV